MLQLVGHAITQRTSDTGQISSEAFDDALSSSRENSESDVCSTTLAALSEKDVEFLSAVSDDALESRVSDVAERMAVTVDYAQKYRKRLIDAGIIETSKRGFVRFAVPYLAGHLRNGRS